MGEELTSILLAGDGLMLARPDREIADLGLEIER